MSNDLRLLAERSLWIVAGAILFLSFGYTEMAGSDMWWHIAAGREILQTQTIWMVDDWSFTRHGADWLNHEWLSDVIYYAWVSAFGVESIVYWKWLVVIATYGLLQLTLARATGSWTAGFLAAGIAVVIGAPFIDVRPHLYSLLNFSLLLFLLLGQRRPPTWLLALLFVVWVNLHGGFFFGLMALAILIFPWRELSLGAFWRDDVFLTRFRSAFLLGVICVAAALLNPSGYETFLYPLKYAFDTSSPFRGLGEWLPPFEPGGIVSPAFFVFMWAPLAAILYAVPAIRRDTGVPWEGILLTALTLAMSLTSRRFIPIFGISLAVMLAPLFAWLLVRTRAEKVGVLLAAAALVFAIYRQSHYPLRAAPAFHYLTAEYSYPVDMMDLVALNGIQGDVFAYYNWGGYLHWRTDGELRVYIDGRADTIYEADEYDKYVNVLRSDPNWLDIVNASGADYFLWPLQIGSGHSKLQTLWNTGQWKLVYRDSLSYLLARNETPVPERLTAASNTATRDLTLAFDALSRNDVVRANTHSVAAREKAPWHRTGCIVAMSSYEQMKNEGAVEQTARDCYDEFPSRLYLRGK